MDLSFTTYAGPRQRSHFQVRVPRDSWPSFTVSYSRFPQSEGPGPIFISPWNRVSRLYPLALCSLFVASYVSQGYGGGILPHLHTGILIWVWVILRSVGQSVLEQSTHLGLTTRFLLLSDHCGFFIWGALSDERTGLSFTMYNIQYILLSQIWDQVPVFISPRNKVTRLYPQALGMEF
jgi:hypothetical protein